MEKEDLNKLLEKYTFKTQGRQYNRGQKRFEGPPPKILRFPDYCMLAEEKAGGKILIFSHEFMTDNCEIFKPGLFKKNYIARIFLYAAYSGNVIKHLTLSMIMHCPKDLLRTFFGEIAMPQGENLFVQFHYQKKIVDRSVYFKLFNIEITSMDTCETCITDLSHKEGKDVFADNVILPHPIEFFIMEQNKQLKIPYRVNENGNTKFFSVWCSFKKQP